MIRSLSVVRHQHSQRGQPHHLYFQCQLGNPDTMLHRGQKLPPTVLTLFRKKKKACFSKQTWRVKSCNRLRENEREHTRGVEDWRFARKELKEKKNHTAKKKNPFYILKERHLDILVTSHFALATLLRPAKPLFLSISLQITSVC